MSSGIIGPPGPAADAGEGHIFIPAWAYQLASVGPFPVFNAALWNDDINWTYASGQPMEGFLTWDNPTLGCFLEYNVYLAAGTYTFCSMYATVEPSGGIWSICLDAPTAVIDAVDFGAASDDLKQRSVVPGVVVAAGLHSIYVICTGTNNPMNYSIYLSAISLWRTA